MTDFTDASGAGAEQPAEDGTSPGTQSPANEPIGSELGGPDAFGAGPDDTDRSGGNWADADDAGASDTGIAADGLGEAAGAGLDESAGDEGLDDAAADPSGRDDPFDGAGTGGAA